MCPARNEAAVTGGGVSTALLHGAVTRPSPSVACITAGGTVRSSGAKGCVLLRKVIFVVVVLVLGPDALLDSSCSFCQDLQMLAHRMWRRYLQNKNQQVAASLPSSQLATCSDAPIPSFLCSFRPSGGRSWNPGSRTFWGHI